VVLFLGLLYPLVEPGEGLAAAGSTTRDVPEGLVRGRGHQSISSSIDDVVKVYAADPSFASALMML
jgi:hypothetical protein